MGNVQHATSLRILPRGIVRVCNNNVGNLLKIVYSIAKYVPVGTPTTRIAQISLLEMRTPIILWTSVTCPQFVFQTVVL